MNETILIYNGEGAWLPGVPARDLTQTDVEACGRSVDELVDSGLYRSADRGAPAIDDPSHVKGEGENKRHRQSR